MKKLLLMSLMTIVFFACKKDVSGPALQGMDVTSVTWSFRGIEGYFYFGSDSFLNVFSGDINPCFKMNSNNTFSINLNDTVCTGTYSWTPIDTATAIVNFKIQNWQSTSSEVLKKIMSSTDTCMSVRYPNYFYVFTDPDTNLYSSMELKFYNNSGFFVLSYP